MKMESWELGGAGGLQTFFLKGHFIRDRIFSERRVNTHILTGVKEDSKDKVWWVPRCSLRVVAESSRACR